MSTYPITVSCYGVWEITLHGPIDGDPFADQWIKGAFTGPRGVEQAEGFYDGEGEYRLRYMPCCTGTYTAQITTSWGKTLAAAFTVTQPQEGVHGPVRVADTFHFAYDDGTPYYPVGTTCYVWEWQSEALQQQTLRTLEASPFNKIRFCVFPKHYAYNLNEPCCYPFALRPEAPWNPADFSEEKLLAAPVNAWGSREIAIEDPQLVWDFSQPNPVYFRHVEQCIEQLGKLGIQADLILFHPYDRWGFSRMTARQDAHYLNYIVRRFAAYHNVWWAMANEYDLFRTKTIADWEANAAVVCHTDPYHHLRSIHQCMKLYDHTRGWITHCSIQRTDLYRTAEETELYRPRYGKPIVLDEIAYEGNLPFGWGNISGEEMTRRFWEAWTRGGYGQHGETYRDNTVWWSHGGTLKGTSPNRIAFLKQIMEECGGYMEPLPAAFDETCCTNIGHAAKVPCIIHYYGFNRPCCRFFHPDKPVRVEVIDTWNMTVTPVGRYSGDFTVELPSKPYMAIRLIPV